MQRKKNEEELGRTMRRYGFYAYKWRDRGYMSCPICHTVLKTCPRCHRDMLMPKAETKPDFLVAFDYIYVEGKGATDRWAWGESITPNQRRVMVEHEGWLFLEIGEGHAPEGREAYLVPWNEWLKAEDQLEEQGFASLAWRRTERSKNPTAREILGAYRMVWDDGDWAIPMDHIFWIRHSNLQIPAALEWNNDGTGSIPADAPAEA